MTITKERAEELRNKLLLRLQADLEEILHTTIEEAGKDPLGFLLKYISAINLREGNVVDDLNAYVIYYGFIKQATVEDIRTLSNGLTKFRGDISLTLGYMDSYNKYLRSKIGYHYY